MGCAGSLLEGWNMPKWIFGTVLIVYMAGTFGFGLSQQISGQSLNTTEAMRYGAAWPWIVVRMLETD